MYNCLLFGFKKVRGYDNITPYLRGKIYTYKRFKAMLGVWLAVASNVADACCNI